VIAGLLLAVDCALAGSVSVLLKQRGAVAVLAVLGRHPVRSAINRFRSKWWTVGVSSHPALNHVMPHLFGVGDDLKDRSAD
jgi:hypothetical protein